MDGRAGPVIPQAMPGATREAAARSRKGPSGSIPVSLRRCALALVKVEGSLRSTAAMTVFLLFAAVLLIVTPAEASIPRAAVANEASASLQLHEYSLAAPALTPCRFTFAEGVSLLDGDDAPRLFSLSGPETSRCERTYARNNPLRFIDPDGREEMDAVLMANQRMQLRDTGGEAAVQRFDRTNLAMGAAAIGLLGAGAGASFLLAAGSNAALAFGVAHPTATAAATVAAEMGVAGLTGAAVGTGAANALFARAVSENIAGFGILGTTEKVGSTLVKEIAYIAADKPGASAPGALIAGLLGQARQAGAAELRIIGHGVINQGFLNQKVLERLGFTFTRLSEDTVQLTRKVPQ